MIAFDNVGTIGNRNEYSTEKVQTVSLQPNYVSTLPGKTKNSTKRPPLTAVFSVKPSVPNFRKKSFNVQFIFSCLLT